MGKNCNEGFIIWRKTMISLIFYTGNIKTLMNYNTIQHIDIRIE